MQIKEMKTMFRFSSDIGKIILRGEPGEWRLSVYVGVGQETLDVARGGNRLFKTLDAAYEVARELEGIFSDHNERSLPIEIQPD
jgi:hypothetical protein